MGLEAVHGQSRPESIWRTKLLRCACGIQDWRCDVTAQVIAIWKTGRIQEKDSGHIFFARGDMTAQVIPVWKAGRF